VFLAALLCADAPVARGNPETEKKPTDKDWFLKNKKKKADDGKPADDAQKAGRRPVNAEGDDSGTPAVPPLVLGTVTCTTKGGVDTWALPDGTRVRVVRPGFKTVKTKDGRTIHVSAGAGKKGKISVRKGGKLVYKKTVSKDGKTTTEWRRNPDGTATTTTTRDGKATKSTLDRGGVYEGDMEDLKDTQKREMRELKKKHQRELDAWRGRGKDQLKKLQDKQVEKLQAEHHQQKKGLTKAYQKGAEADAAAKTPK
jgi:hypothetical protein